jgi:hypothetical protein
MSAAVLFDVKSRLLHLGISVVASRLHNLKGWKMRGARVWAPSPISIGEVLIRRESGYFDGADVFGILDF